MTDRNLIDTIDQAVLEEWKVTVDQAVAVYHGDEGKTDGTNRQRNLIHQIAEYLTAHQFDFVQSANPRADEVDEETIARMYHLLRWQSQKYDIWVK